MVLDEDGGIKQAIMYQPYRTISNVVEMGATSTDPLRQKFTIKQFDEDGEGSENGVSGIDAYYFGFGMYDPDVGVWNRPEPSSGWFFERKDCIKNNGQVSIVTKAVLDKTFLVTGILCNNDRVG